MEHGIQLNKCTLQLWKQLIRTQNNNKKGQHGGTNHSRDNSVTNGWPNIQFKVDVFWPKQFNQIQSA